MGLSAGTLAHIYDNNSNRSSFIHAASTQPIHKLCDVRTKEQWLRLKKEMRHTRSPYVIMIYADWCSVCKLEKPVFMRAAAELHDKATFVYACLSTTDTKDRKSVV